MSIKFTVPGIPVPKGSARAFVNKRTGKAIVMQTNREKQKPWASMISFMAEQAGVRPHSGPVLVAMQFRFPRPKAHYNSKGELKPKAGIYHNTKPDVDKLVRCVFDALTGIAWKDDSQAHITSAVKAYVYKQSELPGVVIDLNQIGEPI